MNEVYLCGVIESLPHIYETPGKTPLVYIQLRVTETVMRGDGSAQNVTSYFPVRCWGKKYLSLLKQVTLGTEIKVKGRLARSSPTPKETLKTYEDTYVIVNDDYGLIEPLNDIRKGK